MAGDGAACDFHGHDRRAAFQERNHQNAQHVEVRVFIVGDFDHVGGERTDQAVAQQDSEESSDQGGGDLLADFFGRAAQGAHGDDDAENRGDNSEAGQGIGHAVKRRSRLTGTDGGELRDRDRASDPDRKRRRR